MLSRGWRARRSTLSRHGFVYIPEGPAMRGRSCRGLALHGWFEERLSNSKYMRAWLAVTLNSDAREWHTMDVRWL